MRIRLYDGMAANGITGEIADEIYEKIQAFAAFGFAESHSISFALLVYASSWLKRHYPAAFCAALLNAQPMGFYSPQSLVHDAKRHGIEVRPAVAARSLAVRRLAGARRRGRRSALASTCRSRRCGWGCPRCALSAPSWPSAIVASRAADGPFTVDGRSGPAGRAVRRPDRGAGHCRGVRLLRRHPSRRAVGSRAPPRRPVRVSWTSPPSARAAAGGCRQMTEPEQLIADMWATGITPRLLPHRADPAAARRARHRHRRRAARDRDRTRVTVGGVVTHRQRPATARGVTFLNLEDETGMVNVIVDEMVWQRHRRVAREAGGCSSAACSSTPATA